MESQPQKLEFRYSSENFHPCTLKIHGRLADEEKKRMVYYTMSRRQDKSTAVTEHWCSRRSHGNR